MTPISGVPRLDPILRPPINQPTGVPMFKPLLAFVSLCLMTAMMAANPPFVRGMPLSTPYAFTAIDEHTHPAVGKMTVTGLPYCTIELIDEDTAVTAAHCVGQLGEEVWFAGVKYQVDRIDILPEADMALYTLCEEPPIEPLHISLVPASFGDPVVIVGNGGFIRKQSNPGALYVTGCYADKPMFIMLYTGHATCWPGDSGGALLRNGKLIGIMNFLRTINNEVVDNGCSSILYSLAWMEAHGYDPRF